MKERVFKLIDSIKDMIYSQKYPVNEYLMIHSEKESIDIPEISDDMGKRSSPEISGVETGNIFISKQL